MASATCCRIAHDLRGRWSGFQCLFSIMSFLYSGRLAPCAASAVSLAVLSLCVGVPVSALAAGESDKLEAELDPVVVTASRTPQALSQTLAATTVINREALESSASGDLAPLFQAAGAEVSRTGGLGSDVSVFLRGGSSKQTLLLIDGIAMPSLNFGRPPVAYLPLTGMESIEVVRGNVSSLYGSSAIGGVINVITQRGREGLHASGRVTLGENQTRSVATSLQGGSGNLRYSVGAGVFGTAGFNAIDQGEVAGTNPDRDGFRQKSFNGSVDWQWLQGHELGLSQISSFGRFKYDSDFGPATQADETTYRLQQTAVRSRDQWSPNWKSTLSWSQSQELSQADVTAYPWYAKTVSRQVQWQHDVTVAAGQTVSASVEHATQQLTSDTSYARNHRDIDTLSLGYVGQWGPHQWQLSVRRDDYSDFGSPTSRYVGYGYEVIKGVTLMASHSNGFRAPNFNELFYPWGGNAALRPERANSDELGVKIKQDGWMLRSSYFQTRYRDLISTWPIENIGQARIVGIETSATVRVGRDTLVQGEWTIQDPKDQSNDLVLARRAYHHGSLGVTTSQWGYDWSAAVRMVGARRDRDAASSEQLAAYEVVNVGVEKALAREWKVALKVDNLFDRDYENAYGYRQPGRSAYLTLSWTQD